MKSKNKPKGMNANAVQIASYSCGSPKQYRIDEKIDITVPKNVSDQCEGLFQGHCELASAKT